MKEIYFIDGDPAKPVRLIDIATLPGEDGYFGWVCLLYFWGFQYVELQRLK